jgi:hypothetical protein
MMVVNGLTATNGTAAGCLQQVRLNFLDTAASASVLMLDTVSGRVVTNALPVVSTRRQLAVDLNGGDAILFKFNTGAPFVGFVPPSAARLSATRTSSQTSLTVQGTVDARYQVQSSSALATNNWTKLTNFLPFTACSLYERFERAGHVLSRRRIALADRARTAVRVFGA